ncbi:MAG: hypothetical protein GY826_10940 [Fuerstiella sp.]|nr:hypothetical protein [Fuerstiella sp.]
MPVKNSLTWTVDHQFLPLSAKHTFALQLQPQHPFETRVDKSWPIETSNTPDGALQWW